MKNKTDSDLDELIEETTVDANGEDEQVEAFRQACEENIVLPCDAFVIGEQVSLLEFDYDGNPRRGLTVRCRRADGSEHVVAASEVAISRRTEGAHYLAAYRKWVGLAPWPTEPAVPTRRKARPQTGTTALDLSGPVEVVVLSVKERAARCRVLESDRVVTLRARRFWKVAPGEIAVVRPRKQWSYAGHTYLSGEIESSRLDVAALGLVPLRLENRGWWDPNEHYWGEEGEPIEEWAKPIIARGKRREFEMEQVLPGEDPEEPFSDPITISNDLKDSGDVQGAYKLLAETCEADLRCLDAHAHLGSFVFDQLPKEAIRHYEAGFRIGESCPSQEASTACCRGATSTTVPSSAACTGLGCACGGSAGSRRRKRFSTACCG